MSSVTPEVKGGGKRRRRLTTEVKASLRDLNVALSLFNRHVGGHVELRDVDFDCLEILNRYGPLTPSALARKAGLHPATMTGILDRLQRGRWVTRERDPDAADRRAVTIRPLRERNAELYELLAGMNTSMDEICADYSDAELELIRDFLDRTVAAGRDASDELAGS